MDDLINTLSELRSNYSCFDPAERKYYHALSEAIKAVKTVERKKGRWILTDGYRCSECNHKLQTTGIPWVCPNCGADMRGDEHDEQMEI